MRIAVATIDGTSMSQHFGRSKGFVVFEVDGNTIRARALRSNHHTPDAQGLCDGPKGHEHQQHDHGGIVELLKDCDVVLCGGMGAGAAAALTKHGIKAFVISGSCSADEALTRYLDGTIAPEPAGFCACRH